MRPTLQRSPVLASSDGYRPLSADWWSVVLSWIDEDPTLLNESYLKELVLSKTHDDGRDEPFHRSLEPLDDEGSSEWLVDRIEKVKPDADILHLPKLWRDGEC